jgi:putative iron-dependent peroxidase
MASLPSQPGILADLPPQARYLSFQLAADATAEVVREELASLQLDEHLVVGIGPPVAALLGAEVPGLRPMPHLVGAGVEMPSTPAALWCWLRGEDRGELVHATYALAEDLAGCFELVEVSDAFVHREGRDLSGYVDGTENPTGAQAAAVALLRGAGAGLDGSSFVSTQIWVHDLHAFHCMDPGERDDCIGRRLEDNEEFDAAPASAHVKRTAQESYDPEAFLVRRSMPWADPSGEGLVFVAFAASLDPFEAICRRMVGLEDGIVDALFRFTRPLTGSQFWCPPVTAGGRLELAHFGA